MSRDNMSGILILLCLYQCLVDTESAWSPWNAWSPCTVTCGVGVRTRERTCETGPCTGMTYGFTTCVERDCDDNNLADDPTWSPWSDWSACSQTCGGGKHVRTRTCSSGNISDCCEGADPDICPYEYSQSRDCINDDCLGTWTDWKPWGKCSVSCGEGIQTRHRHCEPGGSVCFGGGEQARTCYVQCLQQERMIAEMDATSTCSPNLCKNNGLCASNRDSVICICSGPWRGRDCSNLCLNTNEPGVCSNKEGIFHSCTDCSKFIICSRGDAIVIPCTDGRIWTGDGCKPPNKTRVLCFD